MPWWLDDFLKAAKHQITILCFLPSWARSSVSISFFPHKLLSAHDFCSIQYFACFSHLELWHYQGCYLPRICNPESLLCARTLEKLRQPGSVDVVGKKRQSVEAHLSRMKVWMIAFQIGMPPVGASTSSLSPLDVDFTHLCPTKKQNVKEATSPHVLLVFTYALARHWALGFA